MRYDPVRAAIALYNPWVAIGLSLKGGAAVSANSTDMSQWFSEDCLSIAKGLTTCLDCPLGSRDRIPVSNVFAFD